MACRLREGIILIGAALNRPHLEYSFWYNWKYFIFPSTRKMWIRWTEFSRGHRDACALERLPCEEIRRELSLFSLQKKWLWGDDRAAPNVGGEGETGSSQHYVAGEQENRLNMKQELFRLGTKKTFYSHQYVPPWENIAQRYCAVSIPGGFLDLIG